MNLTPPSSHVISAGTSVGSAGYENSTNSWVRYPDPQCWTESKDIVFVVEESLFRIDIGRLKNHSVVIHDIFTIPPSQESTEGTELHPIRLEGIKASAMASFIKWLNHFEWEPLPLSENALEDILSVSHMWNVTAGVKYAVAKLAELRPPLRPSRQLELAIRFEIQDWVQPAVSLLVVNPLGKLTNDDIERFPPNVFAIIAKAREAILCERIRIAFFPPPFHCRCDSSGSGNSPQCGKRWKEMWRSCIACKVVDIQASLPLAAIPGLIRGTSFPGVSDECLERSITYFVDQNIFQSEVLIFAEVSTSIRRICNLI